MQMHPMSACLGRKLVLSISYTANSIPMKHVEYEVLSPTTTSYTNFSDPSVSKTSEILHRKPHVMGAHL